MAGRTVEHLLQDVTFALKQGLGPQDLVPMLQKLAGAAPPDSDASRFARLCLARQLLGTDPFRAAALTRILTKEEPSNDEAWGLYGLSLTILGHYHEARRALERACQLAPEHPGHAHNLGHLLDAAFHRPLSAIPWLRSAFDAAREEPSLASSYAHALSGAGQGTKALEILVQYGAMDQETARETLLRWQNASDGDTKE